MGFPITYGLAHIKGHLKPWKYMYLFGGAITILWAFVIYFLLPPDPIRARGLSERERYIAVARLRMNNAGVRNLHFKKAHAFELLRDEKFWLVMAMGYLSMIGAAPVTAFAPIIVAGGFKVGVFRTILYLAPAGVFVGMVMIGTTYLAYKVKNIRCIIISALKWSLRWRRSCYGSCPLPNAALADSSSLATSCPGSVSVGAS